ncbi:MAG: hypothetical protein ACHWZW_14705 [Spirulina sp.]
MVDISKMSTRGVVDVIVLGWNPNISIELSLALVREWISDFEPTEGCRLIAKVNISAEKLEDLYLTDFERAIEPEEIDKFR